MTPLPSYDGAERFSPGWFLQKARNLFYIALVTVLIWVYADMEFTDTAEIRATIQLTAAGNPQLVLLSKPAQDVQFTLRGDRSTLEQFRQDLLQKGSILPPFDVTGRHGAGTYAIPTREIIEQAGGAAKAGLSVVAASPAAVSVVVDTRLQIRDVPVQVDYANATLAGPPTVVPAKVDLVVPQSRWKSLPPDVAPEVKTVRLDLKNVSPDKPMTFKNVELVPAIGPIGVEFQPATVTVTVQVSQATETRTFTVAVRTLDPATWAEDGTWDEFKLDRKEPAEWVRPIQVTGSRKDLDQLKGENLQAYIPLTDDDKKPVASWLTREVVVRFPEDLNLKLVGEKPSVQFKMIKRTPGK